MTDLMSESETSAVEEYLGSQATRMWQLRVLRRWIPHRFPDAQDVLRRRAAAKKAATDAKRRAAELQRTPAWANLRAIGKVYETCQLLSTTTGIPHHVDHIIPLQGRNVSGLHVETNLQILTATENARKHNRYEVEA